MIDEERLERFLRFPNLPGLPGIGNPSLGLPNLRGGNSNPLVSINGSGGGTNAPGGNGGLVFAPTFIFAKAKAQAAQQG